MPIIARMFQMRYFFWAIFIALLALLPEMGLPRSWLLYIFLFFIYLAMASMWNLLCGYCGLISLCQPAFIGLAGYALVVTTWNSFSIFWGILLGCIVSALFAGLISIPTFRLRGIYFAIGTLVVPEAMRVIFFLWRPVGGTIHGKGAGYMIKGLSDFPMAGIYWLALSIGVISVIIKRFILTSKMGLGLSAIRDNEDTASSSGVNVYMLKLITFVISAVVTAVAGAIFFMYQGYIEPTGAFSMNWTMILMLATVIGGIGIEKGPIIGTAIIVFLHFELARYGGVSLLIQGILLIIIMLLMPGGIMGYVQETKMYAYISGLVRSEKS
ncbi:MAG: branched-chain amino acid ABC transporter permease [Thermoproteota archaeon]|nr:MAG: branched-chain amino acid ABC transporter permease [Candidatus Korarchaeota archaeon]